MKQGLIKLYIDPRDNRLPRRTNRFVFLSSLGTRREMIYQIRGYYREERKRLKHLPNAKFIAREKVFHLILESQIICIRKAAEL